MVTVRLWCPQFKKNVLKIAQALKKSFASAWYCGKHFIGTNSESESIQLIKVRVWLDHGGGAHVVSRTAIGGPVVSTI